MNSCINKEKLPFGFCPGCGHGMILLALDKAISSLGLDPKNTVIVTDIGCCGISDRYFTTNTFHGLHGRSITYATGIKLAKPHLNVIVIVGDGGIGIGGNHVINAARRNIGITVLVFNNFNFGMTGGEHSVTTPRSGITTTMQSGNIEEGFDICKLMSGAGASFIARGTVLDKDLPEIIKSALMHDGFSIVDIWDLCAAYFGPKNQMNRSWIDKKKEEGFSFGVVENKMRPEYSRLVAEKESMPIKKREPKYNCSKFKGTMTILISGSAGQKIRSTSSLLGFAATISGLHATQRDDFPITVLSGYSVSEMIISDRQIHSTAVLSHDMIVILSEEGIAQIKDKIRSLPKTSKIYVLSYLAKKVHSINKLPKIISVDITSMDVKREYLCLLMICLMLRMEDKTIDKREMIEAIRCNRKKEIARQSIDLIDDVF